MTIRAALLDMDGTIFDAGIDWLALRERIRIPWDGRAILEQLREAPPDVRDEGLALLEEAERSGAEGGRLIHGAHELLALLRRRNVRCALVTNNSRCSADTVLRRYPLTFDRVLTRDDGPCKPDPAGFLRVLDEWGMSPSDAVAIGDAHLDLMAAHRAGVAEVILVGLPEWMRGHLPDAADYHEAADLLEARDLIERMIPA